MIIAIFQVEELSRFALNRRYRLLPHYYTLFHKTHTTGVPVMTPVFFAGMWECDTHLRDFTAVFELNLDVIVFRSW